MTRFVLTFLGYQITETVVCQKRRGPFQSVPVLRAFLMYFTSHGIQMRLPSDDPGRPIGALALAAAAVGWFHLLSGSYSFFFSGRAWLFLSLYR